MTTPKRLHLGCGTNIKKGWINLDKAALPGVDVVHDIEQLPLPFADGSFDEILCEDILEHVAFISVLRELHRIAASGGTIAIRVPHFTSRNNFVDPTHRVLFSSSTFDFFVQDSARRRERPYYFDFSFSAMSECRITFASPHESKFFLPNPIVAHWVNKSAHRRELYEATFLSRFFPAQNIVLTLKR